MRFLSIGINLLKKLEKFEAITNIVVINEVVWILRKKYGIESEEIFDFLDRFLNFVEFVPSKQKITS